MFTGIIEGQGRILSIEHKGEGAVISVSIPELFSDVCLGESIAVNGICLTVTSYSNSHFTADISRETMDKSTFRSAGVRDIVNLERSLRPDSRIGGHFVQGHVDTVGYLKDFIKMPDSYLLKIDLPENTASFTVDKGSIAVDGISLTIAEKEGNRISIYVIPHTFKETSLSSKKAGDGVNIETDILGKYVRSFLDKSSQDKSSQDKLSMDFLNKHGF